MTTQIKDTEKYWTELVQEKLVGRKITRVEYMPKDECENILWQNRPISIQLDNGHWITPIMDDEGNDGGAISTTFGDLGTIPVI